MRILICLILIACWITSAKAHFSLSSPGFVNGGKIPRLYSCSGKNVSPQLNWKDAPDKTHSFALIFASPDWSAGYVYLWILYNIPNTINSLEEGANKHLPKEILVGTNWYDDTIYRGPCPPDDILHHYVFTIYALDTMIDLPKGASGDDLTAAMEGHILEQASITGQFSH